MCELEWSRPLSTMTLTGGVGLVVSMPAFEPQEEDILNIHRDIN